MKGCRGYIGSRIVNGRSVPQHIQQQVIRAYCEKHGLKFLLSATEYCMGGTMMLDAALEEDTDGIVMYSLYLMPRDKRKRLSIAKPIHFAAENCQYTPEMEETFDLMELYDNTRSQFPAIAAYLNAA